MSARLKLDYSRMALQALSVLKRKNTVPGRIMGLQDSRGLDEQEARYALMDGVGALRLDEKKASPRRISLEEANVLIEAIVLGGKWKRANGRLYPGQWT